jgi:thioredoxin reductase
LFAAGDITTNSNKVRQSLTSMAEWAIAANSVHEDFLIRK